MATDLERLVLTIEANTRQLQTGLKRVEAQVSGSMGRAAKSTKVFNSALDGATKAAARLAATFVTAAGLRQAQQLIDGYTKIQNALKVTGLEGDNLKAVYDQLFASAQKNGAPLDALVTLYSRASQAAGDLGATQADLIKFTDGIALALRVSGQSAEESSGALLQLSQALGNGKVQAEEYNSLLDGGRPILQAVAAGLKEAGGSVSALTQLVKSGQVSSEAFFRAFQAGSPILAQQAASSVETISQRLQRLQNSLTDAAGRFNNSTEAASSLGAAIDQLAAYIDAVNFDNLIAGLDAFLKQVDAGIATIQGLADAIGRLTGLENVGAALLDAKPNALGMFSTKDVQDRVNAAFAGSSPSGGALTPEAIRAAFGGAPAATKTTRLPTIGVKPISLSDFAAPAATGGGSGGGGGGGRSKAVDDAQRQKKAIDDVVDSLKFEQDQLGRTDAEQRLYNELKSAGVERNSAAGQQIEQLVTKIQKEQAAMESARQLSDLFGNSIVDALSGIISGSSSAEDALKGLVEQLARAALQASLLGDGPLAGIFGTAGTGGLLGSIFGGFRAAGGPVSAGKAYLVGENGPELFAPRGSGSIISNADLRAPSITPSNDNGLHITVGVSADSNGNLMPFVESVARRQAKDTVTAGIGQYDRSLNATMGKRINRAQTRQL